MFCVCVLYVWYVSGICICISVPCTKPVLTETRCCCWVSHSADLSYSLTQHLSLNLELACQPLRLSNPLVSSYWWQTFPLGKHNTHGYSVPIGIQRQSTDSPTWFNPKFYWGYFQKNEWVVTYKSRNNSKAVAPPKTHPKWLTAHKNWEICSTWHSLQKIQQVGVCLFQVTLV